MNDEDTEKITRFSVALQYVENSKDRYVQIDLKENINSYSNKHKLH